MSLLLDENLSPRLVGKLSSLFPGIVHVRDIGLKQARALGNPPKVIHLEQCDFPYRVVEDILRRNAVRIADFDTDSDRGVLQIRLKHVEVR